MRTMRSGSLQARSLLSANSLEQTGPLFCTHPSIHSLYMDHNMFLFHFSIFFLFRFSVCFLFSVLSHTHGISQLFSSIVEMRVRD